MECPTVTGTVVNGLGLGRQLGFPTANVALDDGCQPPPRGVYCVEALWDSQIRAAVCSVGVRPTLGEGGELLIEVYIPDFSGDLYGRRMEVRFLEKIRDEANFPSLEALKKQIAEDVAFLKRRP